MFQNALGHLIRDAARSAARSSVEDGARSRAGLRQVAFPGRFQFGAHRFAVDGLFELCVVPEQSFVPVDVRRLAVLPERQEGTPRPSA